MEHCRKGCNALHSSAGYSQLSCSKVAGLDLTGQKILSGVGAQLLTWLHLFCRQAGGLPSAGGVVRPQKEQDTRRAAAGRGSLSALAC